ncbi:hypothetical protein SNEBB_001338 [Seison nebaliae]|nr:hypothetical protein SNEBB_001338 [Seison nebaliae]
MARNVAKRASFKKEPKDNNMDVKKSSNFKKSPKSKMNGVKPTGKDSFKNEKKSKMAREVVKQEKEEEEDIEEDVVEQEASSEEEVSKEEIEMEEEEEKEEEKENEGKVEKSTKEKEKSTKKFDFEQGVPKNKILNWADCLCYDNQKKIFVKRIKRRLGVKDLLGLSPKIDKVSYLPHDKRSRLRFAYLTFKSAKDAEEFFKKNKEENSLNVFVDQIKEIEKDKKELMPAQIHLAPLTSTMTEEVIRKQFSNITEVQIVRRTYNAKLQMFAFVKFKSHEDADKALKKQLIQIDGHKVAVSKAFKKIPNEKNEKPKKKDKKKEEKTKKVKEVEEEDDEDDEDFEEGEEDDEDDDDDDDDDDDLEGDDDDDESDDEKTQQLLAEIAKSLKEGKRQKRKIVELDEKGNELTEETDDEIDDDDIETKILQQLAAEESEDEEEDDDEEEEDEEDEEDEVEESKPVAKKQNFVKQNAKNNRGKQFKLKSTNKNVAPKAVPIKQPASRKNKPTPQKRRKMK